MNSQKGFIAQALLILIALVVFGGGYTYYKNNGVKTPPLAPVSTTTIPIVGNDRDVHGCIGSAGYSWCAVKNKCLRVWEEKCEVATTTPIVFPCPQYMPPAPDFCTGGKIIGGRKDANGCIMPPVCQITDVYCTADAMQCPDGTYVGRSGPECKFVCPVIVGGDKDIHGCLGSAGYSWCAVKNKCLRVWEEKCE